jgi:transglutaminase-like putative cysteine protease
VRYRVKHITTYRYADEFASCHNQVHLIPRDTDRQICHEWALNVQPTPDVMDRHDDSWGNHVASFSLHTPSDRLRVESELEIELFPGHATPMFSRPWSEVRDLLAGDDAPLEALPFLFESPYVAQPGELVEFAKLSFPAGRSVQDAARDLMKRIYTEFKFDPKATDVGTSVREVLARKRGVCQDFAHLMIGSLRSMGLAARYVSGYLLTDPAPGKPRLVGADASHAWASVWCPQAGWVDYDPTNNLSPCNRHITISWGRDYGDVSPVRGVVLGGGGHEVVVEVDVAPIG